MTRAFAYIAFVLSAISTLWFVAGWVEASLSAGAYSLLRWPALGLTIALPVLAVVFLVLGVSVMPKE